MGFNQKFDVSSDQPTLLSIQMFILRSLEEKHEEQKQKQNRKSFVKQDRKAIRKSYFVKKVSYNGLS